MVDGMMDPPGGRAFPNVTRIAERSADWTPAKSGEIPSDRFEGRPLRYPSALAGRVNLQEQRSRIDVRMIVRQQVERHRGNLPQQFVERRRVCRGENVIAMPAPHRGLVVPSGGNREDHQFRHIGSIGGSTASAAPPPSALLS